jgi:hypothetical protein
MNGLTEKFRRRGVKIGEIYGILRGGGESGRRLLLWVEENNVGRGGVLP